MKKIKILMFINLIFCFSLRGTVFLTSQAEVNAFSYTNINELWIQGSDITDLSPLAILESVNYININNTSITNVDVFSNLINHEYSIVVDLNPLLNNLDGFSSCWGGSRVDITNCSSLTNIDGLSNILGLGSDLNIISCPSLTNINGLSSLQYVIDELRIVNCDLLSNLNPLSSVTGAHNIYIHGNDLLTEFCGLFKLVYQMGENIQFWYVYGNGQNPTKEDVISFGPCSPSNFTASQITSNSCTLSWTENGSANSWEINIGLTGFDPDNTSPVEVTTNPYNAVGLTENVTYDWYVSSVYNDNIHSDWIGPASFTTLGDSQTENTPTLWTATHQCGIESGALIRFNPAEAIPTLKKVFNGATTGGGPSSQIFQASNGKWYGTTNGGGQEFYWGGALYEYDPLTNQLEGKVAFKGIEKITGESDFIESTGITPISNLVEVNAVIYGMTKSGGDYANGILYSYDLTNSASPFEEVYHFPGSPGGSESVGGLSVIDNIIYGTTTRGGDYNEGTIFSLDPSIENPEPVILYSFHNPTGHYPNYCKLIEYPENSNDLYGITTAGGTNGNGVIFMFDLDAAPGSRYSVLHNLDQAIYEGTENRGSLAEKDGVLYGFTKSGGEHEDGVLFKYDLTTTPSPTFAVLHHFNDAEANDGKEPWGTPYIASDGNLYGMARIGGEVSPGERHHGYGTIFQWDFDAAGEKFTKLFDFDSVHGAMPYPSNFVEYVKPESVCSGMEVFLKNSEDNLLAEGVCEYKIGEDWYYANEIADGHFCIDPDNDPNVLHTLPAQLEVRMSYRCGQQTELLNSDAPHTFSTVEVTVQLLDSEDNPVAGGSSAYIGSECGFRFSIEEGPGIVKQELLPVSYDFYMTYNEVRNWKYDVDVSSDPVVTFYTGNFIELWATTVGPEKGKLFRFDLNDNSISVKHHFVKSVTGNGPYGSILQVEGGLWYGLTWGGGTGNDYGGLYQYNPRTNELKMLHDFPGGPGGAYPIGKMVQYGNYLYGTTKAGGGEEGTDNGNGTLFRFDLSSHELDPDNVEILVLFNEVGGKDPYGNLMELDGKIYGTTSQGGDYGQGTIFSYDPALYPDESAFTREYNFPADRSKGAEPYASELIYIGDGKLLGLTKEGGTGNDSGVVYEFDVNETDENLKVEVKDEFSRIGGNHPWSYFTEIIDNKLYGVTSEGGDNNDGILFMYDLDASSDPLTKLHDFEERDGKEPTGALLRAKDGRLYGMTASGGVNGNGIIYCYDLTKPVSMERFKKLFDFGENNATEPRYNQFIEYSNPQENCIGNFPVYFKDSQGRTIPGGVCEYREGAGSEWQYATEIRDGVFCIDTDREQIALRLTYGPQMKIVPNISTSLESYTFSTVSVTVQLLRPNGTVGFNGGKVAYSSYKWPVGETGDDGDGIVRCEMLPITYKFYMEYSGGTQMQQVQITPSDKIVSFQCAKAIVQLKNSSGDPGDGNADVFCKQSGKWVNIGTTDPDNNSRLIKALLPGTYKFKMEYKEGFEIKNDVDIVFPLTFLNFQTSEVIVKLLDDVGNGIDGGAVKNGVFHWNSFGTTDLNGEAISELLPCAYDFLMEKDGLDEKKEGIDVNGPTEIIFYYDDLKNGSLAVDRDIPIEVYPNPFNNTTSIAFSLNTEQNIRIAIYDLNGALVEILQDGILERGKHKIEWQSKQAIRGVYLVRFTSEKQDYTKRIVKM